MKRLLIVLLTLSMISGLFTFEIGNVSADEVDKTADVGTTYYVSTLKGKDTNNGKSEDTPFYSLSKINELTLQPGDKVLLERGSVFNYQYLHIKGSGSAEYPIIVDAYGDESKNMPVIDAKGQGIWYQDFGNTESSQHVRKGYVSSTVLLYDVEYIELNNLEIVNNVSFQNEDYSLLRKMDRTGVAVVSQNKGTVDHIVLNNLYVHDIRGNVYNKQMNNGGIIFTMFVPENEEATGTPTYNDILIENCFVENVSRWGISVAVTAYAYMFNASAEVPDDLCKKYGCTNVVIRNNYLKDIGGDAITTKYCLTPLIEYNVSDNAAMEMNSDIYSATTFSNVSAAIWPWKCKNAVLQYNEVFDTAHNGDGQAWDADYGDGTVYQYNYSHNNGGGCLMVCGINAINTTFRYNISYKDLVCALDLPDNAPLSQVYNNVFYMEEGVPFLRVSDRNNGANQTGTAVVRNNIIYNSGAEKSENWSGKNSTAKMTYSNNLYYNYTNIPESDKNAVTGDPLFWGAEAAPTISSMNVHNRTAFEGFKISKDSPAIDAGVAIDGFTGTDFFGNEVTGTPDIGAYEYQEGDVPSGEVDKTELLAEIEKAKALEDYTNADGTYTESSYSKFSEALAKAIEVSESETATQLDVIAAKNNLTSAIEGLLKTDPNFYMYKEDFTVNTSGAWLQWSSSDGQSSGVASQEAANDIMFDGKEAGFWLSQNDIPNVYIDVVFGDTAKTVKGFEYVARENGNNKIKTVEILVSENGTEFTSAGTYTPEYDGQTAEIIFNEPITAKYIRIKPTAIQNDASTGDPNKLAVSELKIMKAEKVPAYEKGDVNHDNTVDINDATLVQQYVVCMDISGIFDLELADMNEDGKITINDATLIQIKLLDS